MKNLYTKKGKIHPSPPPPPSVSDRLSLLPATILTFAAALSEEDREVLAYLISCSGTITAATAKTNSFSGHHRKTSDDDGHDPVFNCNCFSCYMSFWVRWDTSPSREKIHDIIEAYEEGLFKKKKKSMKKKKDRGKQPVNDSEDFDVGDDGKVVNDDDGGSGKSESMEMMNSTDQNVDVELEKSTVRKITSFLGEKIWGIWSRD